MFCNSYDGLTTRSASHHPREGEAFSSLYTVWLYTNTVRQTLPKHSLYTVWAVHRHSPTDSPYKLPLHCVGCTPTQSDRLSLYTPCTLCGLYTNTVRQTVPIHSLYTVWDVHGHSPKDTPYTLPLHCVGCTPTQSNRHSLYTGMYTDTVRQTLPIHSLYTL